MGGPSRFAIVPCPAERPSAAGDSAEELPITRQAVSRHLRVLRDAGPVASQAQGTRRIYRLNPAGVAALRDQLDAFWRRAATSGGPSPDLVRRGSGAVRRWPAA